MVDWFDSSIAASTTVLAAGGPSARVSLYHGGRQVQLDLHHGHFPLHYPLILLMLMLRFLFARRRLICVLSRLSRAVRCVTSGSPRQPQVEPVIDKVILVLFGLWADFSICDWGYHHPCTDGRWNITSALWCSFAVATVLRLDDWPIRAMKSLSNYLAFALLHFLIDSRSVISLFTETFNKQDFLAIFVRIKPVNNLIDKFLLRAIYR